MRPLAALALLALTLPEAGCKRKLPPPPAPVVYTPPAAPERELPAKAPTAKWSQSSLTFADYPGVNASFTYDSKGKVNASFNGFPKGTKLKVAGVEASAEPFRPASLSAEVTAGLGAMDASKIEDRSASPSEFRPALTFSIGFSNGITFEDKLPPIPSYALDAARVLAAVESGPLRFDSDAPKPSGRTLAALFTVEPKVLGGAKTLDAVAWVALESRPPARAGKQCDGYQKGSSTVSYALSMQDITLKVYERRTGKIAAEKTFAAPPRCPSIAINGVALSGPDRELMLRWLASVPLKPST